MRYQCKKCGSCCRLGGETRLTCYDIDRALGYMGLTFEDFAQIYPLRFDNGMYYVQPDQNGACRFLREDNCCELQTVKPAYCDAYIPPLDGIGSPTCDICQGIGCGDELTQDEIDRRNRIIEQF